METKADTNNKTIINLTILECKYWIILDKHMDIYNNKSNHIGM